MILPILNRTAAEIAAAALFEMFPDVQLWGGGDTSMGFFYDFHFPHPLSFQMEVLIEERMRQIARERRPIRTLEMVPVSARQFLIKEGRGSRVEEIEEGQGLVELIQIGSFFDLSPGPHLKNSHELSSFKLEPIETLKKGAYRLTGCAFPKKEELKKFLKKKEQYREKSHLWMGEKKSLWKIWRGEVLWLQEGLKGLRDLTELLRCELFKGFLEIGSTAEENREDLHRVLSLEMRERPLHLAEIYQTPLGPWNVDSGLFSAEGGTWIQRSSYLSSTEIQESFISSLQSVRKTLNILGFEHRLCLTGSSRSEKGFLGLSGSLESLGLEFEVVLQERGVPHIDLLVEDNLGRRWVSFSCHLVEKGFAFVGSIERLYALLLERSV